MNNLNNYHKIIFFVLSFILILILIYGGSRHDYNLYTLTWESFINNEKEIPYNSYGPVHLILSFIYKFHFLAPKIFFGLSFILVNYYIFNKILKKKGLGLQEGGRVINLTDKVNKAKALQVFVRFFKKKNQNIKTIAVGDNYNDLDMLKKSDFPCLVFNDKFTLDEIPINNLITTNKPSPEGWTDVIKMALVKINEN